MKALHAALVISLLIFAQSIVSASHPDSAAIAPNLEQAGGLGVAQVDSIQSADQDTLTPSFEKDGGVMAKLVMPALVTAAVGGLLILLFTHRER